MSDYIDYQKTCKSHLTSDQSWDLKHFQSIWAAHSGIYDSVASQADIPAILVAAIHMREADCDFTTYLHNGDPLGKPTTHVPTGVYFTNWSAAAIDAIKREARAKQTSKCTYVSKDLQSMCVFATYYNGIGYQTRQVSDPYILAGTTCYIDGKFTSDGHYDSNAVDKELGILLMLRSISQCI